jgi:hypothetical protein
MSARNPQVAVRTVRKACGWCGEPLTGVHGNAKYHPEPRECAKEAAADRSRRASATARQKKAEATGRIAPEDYVSGTLAVSGVALSGQRVIELRALLHGVLRRVNTSDQYLQRIPAKDLVGNRDLMALQGLVDETWNLITVLDNYLPAVNSGDPYADPVHVAEARAAGEDPRTYIPPPKKKVKPPKLKSVREYTVRLKDPTQE